MTTVAANDDNGQWLALGEGGQAGRLCLDGVRQVIFTAETTEAEGGERALVWCADGLWEIADPAALARLRAWAEGQ